jgi:hypothetical protein
LRAFSGRTGLREATIRAIEDGRFDALPAGIYARAAVRTYASAAGLDPDAVLAACADALPPVVEPIRAMARLRGVPQRAIAPAARPSEAPADPASPCGTPDWRALGAAAVDAFVVGGMLAALIAIARIATGVPLPTLGERGATAFGVMGVLLSLAYFTWFGGLAGMTIGARALRLRVAPPQTPRVTLNDVTARAARSATDDVRFVAASGAHCRQLWRSVPAPAVWRRSQT